MGYVRSEPDRDPLEDVVNVSLWSGDHFLNGVRLSFRAADDLAQHWVKGTPHRNARGTRFAYIEHAGRALKYVPTGAVILLDALAFRAAL